MASKVALAVVLALAIFNGALALKIRRISSANHGNDVWGVEDLETSGGSKRSLEGEEEVEEVNKRLAGPTGCGKAPANPPNTNMTSVLKTTYNVGDIISYKCVPSYMNLVEGSLSVTCQANGKWSALPICQSYTYGCRRTKEAREYKGTVNMTRCGWPCQPWSVVKTYTDLPPEIQNGTQNPLLFPEYRNPYDAQNYCRNPDPNEWIGPWCYYLESGKRKWGYCETTYCGAFDVFDEYERIPGACGCGSMLDLRNPFGNIDQIDRATLADCRRACNDDPACQGWVYDESLNKCWLKACNCQNSQVTCSSNKYEIYYRKKFATCPGVSIYSTVNKRRHCFYSLYNFNLNNTLVFDWTTSRKLCQDLFPLVSDIATFENMDEWNLLRQNFGGLNIPKTYSRAWIGLTRPENSTTGWYWVNQGLTYGTNMSINYTIWAPGQPSNGYEEQCTHLVLSAVNNGEDNNWVGRWADTNCLGRAPVICEAIMPDYKTSKKREDEAEEQTLGSQSVLKNAEGEVLRQTGSSCKLLPCDK